MPLAPTSWAHEENAPVTPIQLGDCTVFPLIQLHFRVDPTVFFRGLATDEFAADPWYWRWPYLQDGRIVIDIGGFMIKTPTTNLLVDAGMGNGKVRPNPHMDDRQDPWLGLLARVGFAPEDVDNVVFTHLHGDHVGYATRHTGRGWVPTFEHARHLVTAADFDYWMSPAAQHDLDRLGDYMSDSVVPLRDAGVLDLVEPDVRICDEVRLVPAAGHTPGNICIEVASQGQRGLFAGDMIHHAIQLAFPDLNTDYCVDQSTAAQARRALLEDLADTDALLFPAHFPDAVPGRIRSEPGRDGYRYEPITPTNDTEEATSSHAH